MEPLAREVAARPHAERCLALEAVVHRAARVLVALARRDAADLEPVLEELEGRASEVGDAAGRARLLSVLARERWPADAAGGEEEAMLEPMRQLANRLTSKWRKLIAEACLRERMVVVVDTEAPTPTPAKAKGKGRVEVLTEEEDG